MKQILGKNCTCFIASVDDRIFVSGYQDGSIKVTDNTCSKLLNKTQAYDSAVLDLVLDNDDGILITVSYDNLIKIFDFTSGELLGSIQEQQSLDCITSLDVTPDNKNIVVTDISGIIRLWDIQSRVLVKEYKTAFRTTYHTAGLLTVQNHMLYGKELIRKSEIDICDISTGNVLYRIDSDPRWDETIIAISSNGEFAASSYNKTDIRVIYLPTGEIKSSFHAHDEFMTDIFFTKDDNYLVSVSEDESIKIWSLKPEQVYALKLENMFITNVIYSNQNRKLGYINSNNAIVFHEIT